MEQIPQKPQQAQKALVMPCRMFGRAKDGKVYLMAQADTSGTPFYLKQELTPEQARMFAAKVVTAAEKAEEQERGSSS